MATCREPDGADTKDQSLREEQTLTPLAEVLGIPIDRRFGKNQEYDAAHAIVAAPGPILIAWDHNKLCDLARLIEPLPAIRSTGPRTAST